MSVFVAAHNIISALGFTSEENGEQVFAGKSGIALVADTALSPVEFPAALIDKNRLKKEYDEIASSAEELSHFDQIIRLSANKALNGSGIDASSRKTIIILSTTKGNIGELAKGKNAEQVQLWQSAHRLAQFLNNPNEPMVVSNACISGVAAILMGKRLIDGGKYDHAIVVGADLLSRFVVSGFQSFHSLSAQPCRPFDKNRDGLSLGEGAATVVLTNQQLPAPALEVVNGATSNDANHISGPSRTGEGLLIAINKALGEDRAVDFISAHGTATPYNDDMESKAISRAGLSQVPVNSMKGYFGHTLGAAGVIESIISMMSLTANKQVKTLGYSEFGVAEEITIATESKDQHMNKVLKVASGFGGCNAALVIEKHG